MHLNALADRQFTTLSGGEQQRTNWLECWLNYGIITLTIHLAIYF
ncbi:MAG: ABC-type sugar transport system ATPase subunit [Candidatus Endobugula sp.]|jgi:ABC-type sugar transport system ATPase subunit